MRFAAFIAVRPRRRFWLSLFFVAALAAISAIAACSSGDKTLEAVDPQAVTANPTYDQVFAIVHNNCASCHDSGAEEISPLTTCTDIVALRGDILSRIQDNTMPPGVLPRISNEDKLLIQRWVENGAPAPCN